MNVWHLTKLLAGMFALRTKPYELPCSKIFTLGFGILFIVLKAVSYYWFIDIINVYDKRNVISLGIFEALFVAVVWVMILVATIRSTYMYYHILERAPQVIIAVLAMDCFLTVCFLIWLGCLSVVSLPLASGSLVSAGIILGFILIMYWKFMIYIYILVTSMDVSILKAGVFGLFYIMLQHNLAELLLNLVITVN